MSFILSFFYIHGIIIFCSNSFPSSTVLLFAIPYSCWHPPVKKSCLSYLCFCLFIIYLSVYLFIYFEVVSHCIALMCAMKLTETPPASAPQVLGLKAGFITPRSLFTYFFFKDKILLSSPGEPSATGMCPDWLLSFFLSVELGWNAVLHALLTVLPPSHKPHAPASCFCFVIVVASFF